MLVYSLTDLEDWLNMPKETPQLEFKEAKNNFDSNKLLKYCVALANEGGGKLILGVTDSLPRKIVGTNEAPDITKQQEHLFSKLGFRVEVSVLDHLDGRVVVYSCPPRPTGSAYQLDGSYYMRTGSQLRAMSEDQLRKIFQEGASDWLEQNVSYEFSGQDIVDQIDTQRYFELINLPYPENRSGVIDRLEKERLISPNNNGTYNVSRLCLIMLAKDFSSHQDLERKGTRLIVYSGTNKLDTRIDIEGSKGYAIGIKSLVTKTMSHIPQNEDIASVLRETKTLVPTEVIRELIANALIHQDFTRNGLSPRIEIYSNRIEISNPGQPTIPSNRFIDCNDSRNERLAYFMRKFGICEEKGSGIDRVIFSAEFHQLPPPEFTIRPNQTLVTISGYKDFFDLSTDERIRATYQHCCLKHVLREQMTNESLRSRFNLPSEKSANISQLIKATMESELIKPDASSGSSRKNARYVPFWA